MDELHFRALLQHRRIFHAGHLVCSFEGDGFVYQHYGDKMLHADVGNLAIVYDRGFIGGDPHGDLFHLIRLKAIFLKQVLHGVERRLDGSPHRPLLEVGARDLVTLAELLNQQVRAILGHEGIEKIVGPRQNVVDTGSARLNQQCGSHAVARRHAAEVEGFFDVIRVALP